MQRKPAQIIGLDVGSRYVKAVLLSKRDKLYTIEACACEVLPANTLMEREVREAEALSNALRKIKLAFKVKAADVAAAVSGSSVITKVVYMDKGMSDHELETQIELEADSLIPYPLEQVYLDFEEIGDSAAAEDKVDVLLTAAHRDLVDSRVTLFREVQFEPKVMDVEGYALGSALALAQQMQPLPEVTASDTDENQSDAIPAATEASDDVMLCANIGTGLLTLTAIEQGVVFYSKEHQFGVDVLLQDLAIMNSLDKQEAERQLIAGDLPATWQQDSLPSFVSNLAQQLGRATQMYCNATRKPAPTTIWLSGGGACIQELALSLTQEMSASIKVFDPTDYVNVSELAIKQGVQRLGPQLAIATGLACRGLTPWHI